MEDCNSFGHWSAHQMIELQVYYKMELYGDHLWFYILLQKYL
jgi:hypothetical protein